MAALTAAQIEDSIVALDTGAADQQVDFLRGVAIVLDHIAVGFEIERVEQGPPPIRWEMAFEIGHRAQSPRADPSSVVSTLRLRAGWPGRVGRIPLVFRFILEPPNFFRASKKRLPDQGNRSEAASSGAAAIFNRRRPTARAGSGVGRPLVDMTVVGAGANRCRMIGNHRVPQQSTMRAGEKFGIIG